MNKRIDLIEDSRSGRIGRCYFLNKPDLYSLIGTAAITFAMMFAVPSNAQMVYLSHTAKVSVTVNTDNVVRNMSFGTGENIWTASDQLPGFEGMKPGGVPDPTDDLRWNEMFKYAEWLGLKLLRVMIDQHMYNPDQKGLYTWNSKSMKGLERWLSWARDHKVDVDLMFLDTGVEWNTIEGYVPAFSAAKDYDACLDSYIDCIEHLYKHLDYSCIKMVGFISEPNLFYQWLGGVPIEQAWQDLRARMDARGLSGLPLVGSGATLPAKTFVPDSSHYWSSFGVYEFHHYQISRETNEEFMWINRAHQNGKPVIVGEYGQDVFGKTATYKSILGVARWSLIQLNAGIDGLCHWEFTDWDDMDGKWSMINIWDPYKKELVPYQDITPKINQYYLIGLIHRFTAKNSSVLKTSKDNDDIFTAALRSPNGNYSIYVLNYSDSTDHDVTFTLDNLAVAKTLYRYKITENEKDRIDVIIDHDASFNLSPGQNSFTDSVQKNSLYVYTSFRLNPKDNGIISDDASSPYSQIPDAKSGNITTSLPEGVNLGYEDSEAVSSASGIGLHFNKIHLIHPAIIRTISVFVNSPSGKIRLGIYKSKDESPSNLIAKCKEFEPVHGWNTVEVTSQVQCDAGDYWLAWSPSNDRLNVRKRIPIHRAMEGYSAEITYPYGSLPETISGQINLSNAVSSLYAHFTYLKQNLIQK
jgi:hypothetical protein